jgi:hypothetical protein
MGLRSAWWALQPPHPPSAVSAALVVKGPQVTQPQLRDHVIWGVWSTLERHIGQPVATRDQCGLNAVHVTPLRASALQGLGTAEWLLHAALAVVKQKGPTLRLSNPGPKLSQNGRPSAGVAVRQS